LKAFVLQIGLNLALYTIFLKQFSLDFMNIFSLIIHVTFLTMVLNYICCLLQERHKRKYNPEWFFNPVIKWNEIKQSLNG